MKQWIVLAWLGLGAYACATGGGGGSKDTGRETGQSSEPINPKEELAYKKALIRCHKTGGTRIVKINGLLRCF